MANDNPVTTSPSPTPQGKLPIEAIARHIQTLPNGERAQLRRMYLTGRYEADGIVVRVLIHAGVNPPLHPDGLHPWKMLAHCAAVLSGTGKIGALPHAREKSLGAALHRAGLTEDRMLRLTSARGRMLDSLLVQTIRRVAQQGAGPVDLFTIFGLIGHREDKAEEARLRIAREFYTADARSKKETASDD